MEDTPIHVRIEEKLRASLKVEHIVRQLLPQRQCSVCRAERKTEVVDTSGNCGSSFAIVVVSPDFARKMTLARHKLVNQLLADEIGQLHAFSQKTLTPEQWAAEQSKAK